MEFISKLFQQHHDYKSLVFQILVVYFCYKVYKATIIKFQNRRAYQVLQKDRYLETYEGSTSQKQDLQKIKQVVDQQQKETNKKQKSEDDRKRKLSLEEEEKENTRKQEQLKNNISLKELLKRNKHDKLQSGKDKSQKASQKVQHSTYLSAIKGFSDEITDFSFNRKYICASSQDGSIKVFQAAQFFINPENPKFIFFNLDIGYPTALCISQTHDRIYYGSIGQINMISFKPTAEDHKYFQLEKSVQIKTGHSEIKNLFIDLHDQFLITTGEDTFIKIWFMNGTIAKSLNTSYGQHYHSAYNLLKNLLVISSSSTDTSVFEIKTTQDHVFKSIDKVMLLRGEKGKVLDAQIDEKGCRGSLISKEYARFVNTNVEYVRKEDTKILRTFTLEELQKLTQTSRDEISAAASFYVDKNKSLYLVGLQYDLLLFDNQFNLIENIPQAASGSKIKRIVLKEYANSKIQKLLCFVWGEGDDRINLFEFSQYVIE